MTARLSNVAGSISASQVRALHVLRRRRGLSDEEFHTLIGAASVKDLSKSQASEFIEHLGGGELPYPPGCKPAPYQGRRKRTDATRAIHPDHCEQIDRLLREYFDGNLEAGYAWLEKNFEAKRPRDLLTARRAGVVIHVLRDLMVARRRSGKRNDADEHGSGSDADDGGPAS